MRLLKFAALGSLVVLLSACQSLFKPGLDDPLPTERLASEHLKPGCQGEQCPLVNIDTLKFPDEPQLDPIVERALLEMTRENNETPLPASLAAYERQFLDSAEPGWSSYLQAKVREQHDGLVIIELSSYLFTGGAHGMPGRGFINYDRRQHKVLSLQDMLVPGQEEAFWKQAELAHKAWLLANKPRPGRRFPEDLAVPAHPARGIDLRRGDAEVRRLLHRAVFLCPPRTEDPVSAPERHRQAEPVPRPRLTLPTLRSPSSRRGARGAA